MSPARRASKHKGHAPVSIRADDGNDAFTAFLPFAIGIYPGVPEVEIRTKFDMIVELLNVNMNDIPRIDNDGPVVHPVDFQFLQHLLEAFADYGLANLRDLIAAIATLDEPLSETPIPIYDRWGPADLNSISPAWRVLCETHLPSPIQDLLVLLCRVQEFQVVRRLRRPKKTKGWEKAMYSFGFPPFWPDSTAQEVATNFVTWRRRQSGILNPDVPQSIVHASTIRELKEAQVWAMVAENFGMGVLVLLKDPLRLL